MDGGVTLESCGARAGEARSAPWLVASPGVDASIVCQNEPPAHTSGVEGASNSDEASCEEAGCDKLGRGGASAVET